MELTGMDLFHWVTMTSRLLSLNYLTITFPVLKERHLRLHSLPTMAVLVLRSTPWPEHLLLI